MVGLEVVTWRSILPCIVLNSCREIGPGHSKGSSKVWTNTAGFCCYRGDVLFAFCSPPDLSLILTDSRIDDDSWFLTASSLYYVRRSTILTKRSLTETLCLLIKAPSAHNFQLLSTAKSASIIWSLLAGLSRYTASWYPIIFLSALTARKMMVKIGSTALPRNLFCGNDQHYFTSVQSKLKDAKFSFFIWEAQDSPFSRWPQSLRHCFCSWTQLLRALGKSKPATCMHGI